MCLYFRRLPSSSHFSQYPSPPFSILLLFIPSFLFPLKQICHRHRILLLGQCRRSLSEFSPPTSCLRTSPPPVLTSAVRFGKGFAFFFLSFRFNHRSDRPFFLACRSPIYVEIERARLVKRLAKIKEQQGLVAEAADLMQEVAVESVMMFKAVEFKLRDYWTPNPVSIMFLKIPDFTEVYSFIGSVFDPDTKGHVRKCELVRVLV
ncbi:hypothetical protein LINPERPRIM_LOCUS36287 [Linum perenne]